MLKESKLEYLFNICRLKNYGKIEFIMKEIVPFVKILSVLSTLNYGVKVEILRAKVVVLSFAANNLSKC